MASYVIGVDFGTTSGRCVLVNADTGEEVAEAVHAYAHGVMDEMLGNDVILPQYFALQHPADYLDTLSQTIPAVLRHTGVAPKDVVGMGIDFTACTVLPIDQEGVPLCMKKEFSKEPHAYVKLWKHHAAQAEADEINALAKERDEAWLPMYGGQISCEWMLPKLLETLRYAPTVYDATYRYLEAADWLSLVLTDTETHSAPFAGYKGLWNAETGFPSNDFMKALDARLDGVVGTKICPDVLGMDHNAGHLSARGAALCGLTENTVLSLPMIDAHAAMPALNITDEGELMLILGTSACQIVNAKEGKIVEGICGYVKDGVIPGMYTYEAGQAAVGDIFAWFTGQCVPYSYHQEAEARGINLHRLMREKAGTLPIGESGLIALDWWNGNRSILVDSSLKGAIFGLTLTTKPEEIYRALIEATAFGLRVIVEQYEKYGVPIHSICAAGGIANKDEMLMQIYADVLNREVSVAASTQAAAMGSAIYAAVAAGNYATVADAAYRMSKPHAKRYMPISENVEAYSVLYQKYKKLHDLFGKDLQI